MQETIAVLGTGIMGGVWIERLLAADAASPQSLMACDPNSQRLEELRELYGVRVSPDNREGASFGQFVILAPPPPAVVAVLDEIAAALGPDKVVVSLAAAVPLAMLRNHVPRGTPIARVMPNTPSLVGAGVNPVTFCSDVDTATRERVLMLLKHLGETFEISDELMNAVCVLCAGGPALLFPVLEALANAAAQHGVDPATALRAAAMMTAGVGALVRDTGRSPDDLKQMISMRMADESAVQDTFQRAYDEAYEKLEAFQAKLAAG